MRERLYYFQAAVHQGTFTQVTYCQFRSRVDMNAIKIAAGEWDSRLDPKSLRQSGVGC